VDEKRDDVRRFGGKGYSAGSGEKKRIQTVLTKTKLASQILSKLQNLNLV